MELQSIPLSKIDESPLHLRRPVKLESLQELAASIKSHGVLEPLIVRPTTKGRFEIVAGHRRFNASALAGRQDVPALVRELDDKAALEIQVIENLQRADVHPLEEAEGYRQLIEKHGYDVEGLAAKVGKSKGYIYGRIKLCALVKAARMAFLEGELDASTALLVARMPAALQAAITKDLSPEGRFDERLTYRDAQEHIHREYMLQLAKAPFSTSDAMLVPAAGPCTTCPKRTGNQPELFGDVKGADVCTDPQCFAGKRKAHGAQLAAAHRAAGRTVIDGAAGKKLFREHFKGGPVSLQSGSGYVDLADDTYEYSSDYRSRTYRALLGKAAKRDDVVVAVDPHGEVHELVSRKALPALLKKAGVKSRHSSSSSRSLSRSFAAQRKQDEQVRQAVNLALLSAVMSKAAAAPLEKWWPVLQELLADNYGGYGSDELVMKLHGVAFEQRAKGKVRENPAEALERWILTHPKAKHAELRRLITLEQSIATDVSPSGALGKLIGKTFGVDLAAIEKRTRETERKRVAEAAKAKKAAGGKKGSKAKLESGVCRKCGCTETTPCETEDGDACAWTDRSRTLCTACA